MRMAVFLRNIDLYGKPFMFEEKESQKFHTSVGNIITTIVIITCIVIGYLFGKEIYERKNPVVIVSEEITPFSRFNVSDYPVIISFSARDGTRIQDALSVYDVVTTKYDLFTNLTSKLNFYSDLDACEPEKFNKDYSDLVKKVLGYVDNAGTQKIEYYCLHNKDLVVQNEYISPNSTFLNIRFAKCNPAKKVCHPNLDLISKDVYITITTFDAFVDPKNYTHPINYYQKSYSQQVNDQVMKRSYISIEKSNLITNKGWMLENEEKVEFLRHKIINKDINSILNGEVYQVTFDSPSRRQVTTRSYLKLQDLAAKLGGFYNFLYIITTILLKNYVDYNYYFNFLDKLGQEDIKTDDDKNTNTINMLVQKASFKKQKTTNDKVENKLNDSIFKLNEFGKMKSDSIANVEALKNNYVKNDISPGTFLPDLNKFDKQEIEAKKLQSAEPYSAVTQKENPKSYKAVSELDKSFHSNKTVGIKPFPRMNYIQFLWNDKICCRNKLNFHIKAMKKLLSFKNIIKISLDHFSNKLEKQ